MEARSLVTATWTTAVAPTVPLTHDWWLQSTALPTAPSLRRKTMPLLTPINVVVTVPYYNGCSGYCCCGCSTAVSRLMKRACPR